MFSLLFFHFFGVVVVVVATSFSSLPSSSLSSGDPPPHRRRRRRRRRRRGRRRRRLAVFMDRPTSKNTKSPETVQTSLKLYKKRVQNDPQNIQNIMKLSEHAFNPIL